MENTEDYSHVVPRNCRVCGNPISLERLDALPTTAFCVQCSTGHAPKVVHDPEVLCLKASISCGNGFASKD